MSTSGIKDNHACRLLHAGVLLGLLFNSEDRGNIFLWNMLILNGLHGIITQKT
jgi:hypothetical protein